MGGGGKEWGEGGGREFGFKMSRSCPTLKGSGVTWFLHLYYSSPTLLKRELFERDRHKVISEKQLHRVQRLHLAHFFIM
jgi:hypothetical protein